MDAWSTVYNATIYFMLSAGTTTYALPEANLCVRTAWDQVMPWHASLTLENLLKRKYGNKHNELDNHNTVKRPHCFSIAMEILSIAQMTLTTELR